MFPDFKKYRYLVSLFLLSVALLLASFYYFTMFQMFAAAVFLAAINIGIFDYIDERVNDGIDTYTEIVERRNIALALYYLCYCLLIAAGTIASAMAFLSLR